MDEKNKMKKRISVCFLMFIILIMCGCTPDVTPPVIDTDSDGDSEIIEEETPIVIVKEPDYIAPPRQGLELAYSSILEKYEEAAANLDTSKTITMMPDLYEQDSLVLSSFTSICISGDGYYTFLDINGDGILELLISVSGEESFADLYTLDSDGQPVAIHFFHGWGAVGDGISFIHDERGDFLVVQLGDGGEYYMGVYQLNESPGKFEVVLSIGSYVKETITDANGNLINYIFECHRYYPESETTETISEDQFNEYERSYSNFYTDYDWKPIIQTDHFFEKLKDVRRPDSFIDSVIYQTDEVIQLYKAPRVNSEIICTIPNNDRIFGHGKMQGNDSDWMFVSYSYYYNSEYKYYYGWVNTEFLELDNKDVQ